MDSAGNDIATYTYKPFGEIASQTGSTNNPFQFAGEQRDAESGYTYLRARYYDPAIGRFISRDPMPALAIAPQFSNKYVYAFNNPVNLTDPTGLWPWDNAWDWIESNVGPSASSVFTAVAESAETAFYGIYAGSYEALDALGSLPDWVEIALFGPLEIGLTITEAIGLAGSTFFDYVVDGDVANTVPGQETSWWPDFLENLLGGNSEDENYWFPSSELPGIAQGETSIFDADFQWPFGD